MDRLLLYLIAVVGLQGVAPAAFAGRVCAGTLIAAIKSDGANPLPISEGEGYRVTSVRWDPILRQSWAIIARCDHPEWPKFSLRVGESDAASPRQVVAQGREEHLPTVLVVRAGDVVRLWRQDDLLRIELTGVAEESGSLGKMIRVRLLRRNTDEPLAEKQFTGIVRGPSNVEMLR